MIIGLASVLPHTMSAGLVANGVPAGQAHAVANLPPVGSLFAAFLGYNPMEKLLGAHALGALPAARAAHLTGTTFFPQLISGPFIHGLRIAFTASFAMCLISAAASWLRGGKYVHEDEVGPFGAPTHEGARPEDAPEPEEWVPA
jgi:hypothetical protein